MSTNQSPETLPKAFTFPKFFLSAAIVMLLLLAMIAVSLQLYPVPPPVDVKESNDTVTFTVRSVLKGPTDATFLVNQAMLIWIQQHPDQVMDPVVTVKFTCTVHPHVKE